MGREYHVAYGGSDDNAGTIKAPFRTISKAAAIAVAGDVVTVHEGVYREWVKPRNRGLSDVCRIVYRAAEGEKAVIKGSERIESWEKEEGTVWKAVIPNEFFGEYNPYEAVLNGDWFAYPEGTLHPGDVYLNGKSFYEAASLEEVKNPVMRREGYNPPWTQHKEPLLHPEDSICQWYAKTDKETTTIYANFQGADPNRELADIQDSG